jgi:ribosomal protein L11 methyltransferase
MDYIAVSISIQPYDQDIADMLVAELGDIGYESFQTEPPVLDAYIDATLFTEPHLKLLLNQYGSGSFLSYKTAFVPEENWNKDWESQLLPIVITQGKGCSVSAPGKHSMIPVLPKVTYRLVIEPDMTFGTGHHPTTRLMIEFLLELDARGLVRNRRVLDLGCGTGVLAILAAKMGAAVPVHAVDINRRARTACTENTRRNRIPHKVHAIQGDASVILNGRYDLILANIHRNILIEEMDTFVRGLSPQGGHLLLSGFFTGDTDDIVQQALSRGFRLEEICNNEDWASIHLFLS